MGGYKCHGSCGREGKLTEFVEYAQQAGYPVRDEIMEAYQRFKEKGDKLTQYTSDIQYKPPRTLKQLLDSVVIAPQLIIGAISRGEIVMGYGVSGVGKSSLFENLIAHACAGLNFADIFLVMKPLRGLYVAMEMADVEVGLRFETLFKSLGKGEENFMVQTFTDFDIAKPEAQRWLYDTVKQGGYDLIVLDPFEDMHHLDENKSTEMGIAIAPLRKVVNELNCGILLVHHAGADVYDRTGKVMPKRPRGSTAIEDRMDSIFELLNTENQYEKLLHVRKMRRALIPRQKDIILKYDPETLLMSLGGLPVVTKAYKEGANERYRILEALLKVKAQGITDAQIARWLGVDRSTVTRWLSGLRKPEPEMLTRFPELIKWAGGGGARCCHPHA